MGAWMRRKMGHQLMATFAHLMPSLFLWGESWSDHPSIFLPRAEREALQSCSDIGRDFLAATKRQPFDVVHELFENEHVQLLFLFKISLFGTWLVDTMA